MNETVRSMTSGTMDVCIGPYEYTKDIRVNLSLSCDVSFASQYFTKPEMHRYPPMSSICSLYRNHCYRFCSSFCYCVLTSPWWNHICLDEQWSMPSHREGPKNISPSSSEQIPLSSYLVPFQTFQWACKLSLWSPCYRWCLKNPKVHHMVRSGYYTLMV